MKAIFLLLLGEALIAYVILMIVVGLPLYVLELSLGQFSQTGITKLWSAVPFFQGKDCIISLFLLQSNRRISKNLLFPITYINCHTHRKRIIGISCITHRDRNCADGGRTLSSVLFPYTYDGNYQILGGFWFRIY